MKKRRINIKRKENRLRKKLLIFLFFILFFLTSIFSILFGFSVNKKFFISPITKQQSEKKAILEKELKKQNIDYLKIEILQDYFAVQIKDNGAVYIGQNKDIKKQVSSLQVIINRLTIEGKRFKKLDFRYAKPLISF